jgi:hypothetical protein
MPKIEYVSFNFTDMVIKYLKDNGIKCVKHDDSFNDQYEEDGYYTIALVRTNVTKDLEMYGEIRPDNTPHYPKGCEHVLNRDHLLIHAYHHCKREHGVHIVNYYSKLIKIFQDVPFSSGILEFKDMQPAPMKLTGFREWYGFDFTIHYNPNLAKVEESKVTKPKGKKGGKQDGKNSIDG